MQCPFAQLKVPFGHCERIGFVFKFPPKPEIRLEFFLKISNFTAYCSFRSASNSTINLVRPVATIVDFVATIRLDNTPSINAKEIVFWTKARKAIIRCLIRRVGTIRTTVACLIQSDAFSIAGTLKIVGSFARGFRFLQWNTLSGKIFARLFNQNEGVVAATLDLRSGNANLRGDNVADLKQIDLYFLRLLETSPLSQQSIPFTLEQT